VGQPGLQGSLSPAAIPRRSCSVSAGLLDKPLRYLTIQAPVAQLDRASDYGVSGTGRNAEQERLCSATSETVRIRRCCFGPNASRSWSASGTGWPGSHDGGTSGKATRPWDKQLLLLVVGEFGCRLLAGSGEAQVDESNGSGFLDAGWESDHQLPIEPLQPAGTGVTVGSMDLSPVR
jgi:hypothetical protein